MAAKKNVAPIGYTWLENKQEVLGEAGVDRCNFMFAAPKNPLLAPIQRRKNVKRALKVAAIIDAM